MLMSLCGQSDNADNWTNKQLKIELLSLWTGRLSFAIFIRPWNKYCWVSLDLVLSCMSERKATATWLLKASSHPCLPSYRCAGSYVHTYICYTSLEEDITVATCHGDPSLSKWGLNGDPIFSKMGTLTSKMGTQKAHVFKIDWNKQIRWNKAFKKGGKLFCNRTDKLAWDSLVLVVLS